MRTLRHAATRRARLLELTFIMFEPALRMLDPVFRRVGHNRIEAAAAWLEARTKGPLFDCRMCGECILTSTGMTCPMNCPKSLRNGPCGGVRQNGHCEVDASMPCVWVEAWAGSKRMRKGALIANIQRPLDHRLKNRSAWLRHLRLAQSPGRGEA
ncbi:MAG: hypothetical protein HOK61_10935 [Alphaproteobacteria bacterium]|jgi:hypothetical protein|nr:hypothetical protein [Alphaproteobacteria bacterium]